MYDNKDLKGLNPTTYHQFRSDQFLNLQTSYNIIKACVDTITSRIGSSHPLPKFLSSNGDYSLKRKAKNLTKFLAGSFETLDIYEKATLCFRDASIFGSTALKIFPKDGKIQAERVLTDRLLIDEFDGATGDPRQLHQIVYINKDTLAESFPAKAFHINKATPISPTQGTEADIIRVVESWHLPSSEKAGDGKHVISINGCTLLSEEYKENYFPFVFMHFTPPTIGFFGTGLASELVGNAVRINRLLKTINKILDTIAPRIFIDSTANINSQHINNEIGTIIRYSAGSKPDFQTSSGGEGLAQLINHLDWLIRNSFESSGISQLSANLPKMNRLDSSLAIRSATDMEVNRQMTLAQSYERFFMDISKLIIAVSKKMYSDNKKLKVKIKDKKFIESINFSEIDLEEDQYSMFINPIDSLINSPSGKWKTATEWMQASMIDAKTFFKLVDMPDIESVIDTEQISTEIIEMYIEGMIEDGVYTPPDDLLELPRAIKLCQAAELKGRRDKVPEEHLDLVRQFIDECVAIIKKNAAPPMQPQAEPAPPAEPLAKAAVQPVSDILPVNDQPIPEEVN